MDAGPVEPVSDGVIIEMSVSRKERRRQPEVSWET